MAFLSCISVGCGRRHKGAAPRPRERLGVVAEDGDRRRVDEAVGVEPVAAFVDRGVEASGGGRRERRVERGAPREARGGARSRRHPARRGRAHVEARSTAATRDRGRRTRSRSSRAGGRRARGALHSTWPETGRRAPWGAAPRCGSRARGPRGWVPPRRAQWSSSPPSQGCRVSCSRRRVSRSARRMRSTGSREYIRRVSASPETRGTNLTVVV